MKSVGSRPHPKWVPTPIVRWLIGRGAYYLPHAKDQLVSFITDERMKPVWERLEEATLRIACDRNEALWEYADTTMRAVVLLSHHMPKLTKAQVVSTLSKIEKLADGIRTQLELLGPLAAPIRYLPLPTRNSGLAAVTVDNVRWDGLIRMAVSAPGEWDGYTDLELVLDREQISRACDEVLAGFGGIFTKWINSPDAEGITLRNVLQDSMAEYFEDQIDDAIGETVDVLFPSQSSRKSAARDGRKEGREDPSSGGKDMTRQMRRRRKGK